MRAYCVGNADWIFVLPEAEDLPAASRELCIHTTVPPNVSVQLLRPPLLVRLRPGCVFGAAMPETTVDEDSHVQLPPHDVSLASEVGFRSAVDAIADTTRMQNFSDMQLRLSVTTTLATHP